MATLFGNLPAQDPSTLYDDCTSRGLPVDLWFRKANLFSCPNGRGPGRGKILLRQVDLDALGQFDGTATKETLAFSDDQGNVHPLKSITLTKAVCVIPGASDSGGNVYLCDVEDRRRDLARIPIDKAYNVRGNDGSYLSGTLNSGVAWTWQQIIQDLFSALGLGTAATLSPMPDATPENLAYYGSYAWDALHDILDRIAWTIRPDLIADTYSTLVQLGNTTTAIAVAATAAMDRIEDAGRMWDGYPVDPALAWAPEKIRVRFLRRPTPTEGNSPVYTVDVSTSITGAANGTYLQIDDDLTALAATGTPSNSANLTTRAAERAADWKRKRQNYESYEQKVWRDFQPGLGNVTLSGLIGCVVWDDRGGPMRVEAVAKPDGAIEKWKLRLGPPGGNSTVIDGYFGNVVVGNNATVNGNVTPGMGNATALTIQNGNVIVLKSPNQTINYPTAPSNNAVMPHYQPLVFVAIATNPNDVFGTLSLIPLPTCPADANDPANYSGNFGFLSNVAQGIAGYKVFLQPIASGWSLLTGNVTWPLVTGALSGGSNFAHQILANSWVTAANGSNTSTLSVGNGNKAGPIGCSTLFGELRIGANGSFPGTAPTVPIQGLASVSVNFGNAPPPYGTPNGNRALVLGAGAGCPTVLIGNTGLGVSPGVSNTIDWFPNGRDFLGIMYRDGIAQNSRIYGGDYANGTTDGCGVIGVTNAEGVMPAGMGGTGPALFPPEGKAGPGLTFANASAGALYRHKAGGNSAGGSGYPAMAWIVDVHFFSGLYAKHVESYQSEYGDLQGAMVGVSHTRSGAPSWDFVPPPRVAATSYAIRPDGCGNAPWVWYIGEERGDALWFSITDNWPGLFSTGMGNGTLTSVSATSTIAGFTLVTDPDPITGVGVVYANLTDAGAFRGAIGLGTAAVEDVEAFAQTANNLDDLTSLSTALSNLFGALIPINITGSRSDPEQALANLLTALASLQLITDSTTP